MLNDYAWPAWPAWLVANLPYGDEVGILPSKHEEGKEEERQQHDCLRDVDPSEAVVQASIR